MDIFLRGRGGRGSRRAARNAFNCLFPRLGRSLARSPNRFHFSSLVTERCREHFIYLLNYNELRNKMTCIDFNLKLSFSPPLGGDAGNARRQIHFHATHGLCAVATLANLRRPLSRRLQNPNLPVCGTVPRHGIRAINLSPQSPRGRGVSAKPCNPSFIIWASAVRSRTATWHTPTTHAIGEFTPTSRKSSSSGPSSFISATTSDSISMPRSTLWTPRPSTFVSRSFPGRSFARPKARSAHTLLNLQGDIPEFYPDFPTENCTM